MFTEEHITSTLEALPHQAIQKLVTKMASLHGGKAVLGEAMLFRGPCTAASRGWKGRQLNFNEYSLLKNREWTLFPLHNIILEEKCHFQSKWFNLFLIILFCTKMLCVLNAIKRKKLSASIHAEWTHSNHVRNLEMFTKNADHFLFSSTIWHKRHLIIGTSYRHYIKIKSINIPILRQTAWHTLWLIT